MEIDIKDYWSEDEIKEVCREEIRSAINRYLFKTNDIERVINNMAYNSAYKIMDDCLTEEIMGRIREKTRLIIESDSNFGLFRKKDAWGNEDSPAYLEQKVAMEEHKHLIGPLVKKAILERDYSEALDSLKYETAELISDVFKKAILGESDEN